MALDKPRLADTRPAWDIESIIDEAEPAETTVVICVKGSLRARYEALNAQLGDVQEAAANLAGSGPGQAIAERMAELREQMHAHERPFHLRAVAPRRRWRNLLAKLPTKAPDMDAEQYADLYHAWLCTVVAASAVQPAMSSAQVERLADKLSNGDWQKLADAAWKINDDSSAIPFSDAAFVISRSSGARSKQQEPPVDNPDHGSLAGSPDSSSNSNGTPPDD